MATVAYDARVFIRGGVSTSLSGAKNIVIHIRHRFYALTTSPPRPPRARRVAFDPSRAVERDFVRQTVVFSQRRVAKRPPRRRRRHALTASFAPAVKPIIAISVVTARPTTAGPRRAPTVVRRPRSTNGVLVLIARAREITHALVRAHPASSTSVPVPVSASTSTDAPSRCRARRGVARRRGRRRVHDGGAGATVQPTAMSTIVVRVSTPHQRARAGAGDVARDVLGVCVLSGEPHRASCAVRRTPRARRVFVVVG